MRFKVAAPMTLMGTSFLTGEPWFPFAIIISPVYADAFDDDQGCVVVSSLAYQELAESVVFGDVPESIVYGELG
jgi:hypothetical protein